MLLITVTIREVGEWYVPSVQWLADLGGSADTEDVAKCTKRQLQVDNTLSNSMYPCLISILYTTGSSSNSKSNNSSSNGSGRITVVVVVVVLAVAVVVVVAVS